MAIGNSDRTQTQQRGDRVHDINDPLKKRRERNTDRTSDDVDRDIAGDEEDELLEIDEDDISQR